mmetsp:Transcript_6601/g.8655  ORF Transcript_6601/g.8655 Transcript_6601/m.8655 type:complete len:109 (+) Transcript_6601:149-475(+)
MVLINVEFHVIDRQTARFSLTSKFYEFSKKVCRPLKIQYPTSEKESVRKKLVFPLNYCYPGVGVTSRKALVFENSKSMLLKNASYLTFVTTCTFSRFHCVNFGRDGRR